VLNEIEIDCNVCAFVEYWHWKVSVYICRYVGDVICTLTDIEIDKENDIHLINSDLVPLSNSQYDTLVSDVFSEDPDMDDIIRTIDTAQIPTKCTNNITIQLLTLE
jgi:hypothetical protein